MAANVSGTVLSSLFYDHLNSQGDQEGYLLGKVVNHVQDKISDSQISNCKVETVIYIYSYIPWPSEDKMYSASGRVNPTKAITLLQGKHQDLIGWYKFRRNSTLRPSLRERNLHRNLLMSLPIDDHNNFLFLLCSSSLSFNKATHTFDHMLMRQQNGKFNKVAISVINLGDTTHTEYKTQGNLTVNPCSGALRSLVDRFQDDFVSGAGGMFEINRIRGMSSSLHKKLEVLSEQVEQSEVELSALEDDVKLMTYRLMEHEERRKAELMAREDRKKAEQAKMNLPSPTHTGDEVSGVSRKLSANLADHRLRFNVGEQGRRPRQISVDDEEREIHSSRTVQEDINLIDMALADIGTTDKPLEPLLTNDADAPTEKSKRTSPVPKLKQDVPQAEKQPQTRGAASAKAAASENNSSGIKSVDVFSFVKNMIETEKEKPVKMPQENRGKNPSNKQEILSKSGGSKRLQSKTSSSADSSSAASGSNLRGSSPSRAKPGTSSETSETSRSVKTRSRPGQTLRSRSRESPGANTRLGSNSVQSTSRTKSASPSNCRTPLRKTACENGTDGPASMIDERKLSSSPVF